jgi:periplasmic protein TonB
MQLGVAAVVIVAAIGVPLGVLKLGNQPPAQPATTVAPEEPPQVAERETPAKRRVAVPIAPAQPEPVAKGLESKPAPPPVAAAVRPRAGGSASSRIDRESNSGAAQAPSLVASRATTTAPAPVVAAAAMPAREPQSAAPEPPSGRLFDQTGVDDPPRILTRVEPHVPSDLADRRGNDVVVVRILVSHTGHPFQVGLLRRSRLGPSLDDAVVAAVRQWTFSPARKRGEAVSCWFNLGVPVVVN